jgi:hypothetical protein
VAEYAFYLKTDGAAAGADAFRPNLVVTSEPLAGRSLDRFADDRRGAIRTRFPSASPVRDARATLAGADARETEYRVALDHPLPQLSQWHAWIACGGAGYHFCGTTSRDRYPRDMPAFRAIVDSFR